MDDLIFEQTRLGIDNLVGCECLVDPVPRLEGACLLVGKDELALLVLCGLDIDLYLVTDLEVRIVTEFRSLDNTLALVTYVYDHLSLRDSGNDTFHDLVLDDL